MRFMCSTLLAVALLASAAVAQPTGLTVDKEARTVTIDSKIAPRKLASLSEIYPIEVVACWPDPRGKKAHETVVVFDVKPSDVHKALESIGLKAGKPAEGDTDAGTGDELKIYLEIPVADGVPRRVAIERTLVDKRSGKPIGARKWVFTGSKMTQPDPEKPDKVYGADISGTLIAVFPVTAECVIQSELTMKEEPLLKMETDKKLLPAEGTAVKLIIQAAK